MGKHYHLNAETLVIRAQVEGEQNAKRTEAEAALGDEKIRRPPANSRPSGGEGRPADDGGEEGAKDRTES